MKQGLYRFRVAAGDLFLKLTIFEDDAMIHKAWLNNRRISLIQAERIWNSDRLRLRLPSARW